MYWRIKQIIFCVLFFGIMPVVSYSQPSLEGDWQIEKSEHFIVEYPQEAERSWARKVLREAERYYDAIADQVGYTRYKDFWTWDNRVRIIVFEDQEAFVNETGQNAWSRGVVLRDNDFFQSGTIVTYKQEEGFLDGVLPHEISHLILKDFIGNEERLPAWFDEGVAQLQEQSKRQDAIRLMRILTQMDQYVPFELLFAYDIQKETDSERVSLFYAQSVSIVHFLIEKYGSTKFGYLCRYLREGEPFEKALISAYPTNFDSITDLQQQWHKFMTGS